MNIRTHIRRPRASIVIASLALFVALGGSATAATLITGSQIKNGTIAGKDLKNSSVTGAKVKNGSLSSSDLSASAKAALKGAKGDPGPAGQTGPAGTPGAQGPRGIVSPRVQTLGGKDINDGAAQTVLTSSVPAGTYVITAKATLVAEDNDRIQCNLYNGNQSIDVTQWDSPEAFLVSSPMSLSAVATVTTGDLSIECSTNGIVDTTEVNDVKLIAVPVG
jgi:hypothetical protein